MALNANQLRTIHYVLSQREKYCLEQVEVARCVTRDAGAAGNDPLFALQDAVGSWIEERDETKAVREAVLLELVELAKAKK